MQTDSNAPPESSRHDQAARLAELRKLLTPELLAQLAPQPGELERARRKLMWGIGGCGTFLVLAILAILYIPLWQLEGQALDAARDFANAAVRGDTLAAREFSGLRDMRLLRRQVEALAAAAGPGGTVEIHDLVYVDSQPSKRTLAVGRVQPAAGGTVGAARALSMHVSYADGRFRVFEVLLDGQNVAQPDAAQTQSANQAQNP